MYMLHCDKRVVFVCKLQIYIKNIAKACVVRSLKIPQQTRMCLVGKPKKISFFFHCSSRFGFPCCAAFSSACCRSHERQAGNGGNPPGRRDEWAGCSDWSCTWLWNSICVAYGQNLIRATYMLNTSICALRHKREEKNKLIHKLCLKNKIMISRSFYCI